MNFAAASYGGYPTACIERQGFTCRSIPVSHLIFGFGQTIKNVLVCEGIDRPELVLGFAGTDGLKDWVNNAAKWSGQASILGLHNIPVHVGFFEEARKIYGTVRDELRERGEKGYRLYFNGHSRGGPVAAFVMAMFADDYPEYAPLCHHYGFNSALGAGPEFAAEFNRRFPGQAFNIYDERDIVRSLGFYREIPGEQLAVPNDPSVTGHPHKIESLMGNLILSLEEDLGIVFSGLPGDEGFYETLPSIRDLAVGSNGCLQSDLSVAAAASSLAPPHPNIQAMNISFQTALQGTIIKLGEAMAILLIDDSIAKKRGLRDALLGCIDAGSQTFISSMLGQQWMSQLDYSGMGVKEIQRLDDCIEQVSGVIINVALLLAKGEIEAAREAAIWGSASMAIGEVLGQTIYVGPSVDFCNKGTNMLHYHSLTFAGLLGGRVKSIVVDSKMSFSVPIPQLPGLSIGGAFFSEITMQYQNRVYGMNLVHQYKALCPFGGHVKFMGIFKLSDYLGNVNVSAAGVKDLKNGDTILVQYKRNSDFAMIYQLKAANRGNIYTFGIIRDVEWKRWDRYFAEPKNLKDNAPLRHLADHMPIDLGSQAHQACLLELLAQLGLDGVGRSQIEYGVAHDDKRERDGMNIYRSGRRNDYVHQSFFESANQNVNHIKNEDGSETTSFTHSVVGGTDTIRVRHGGGRRILFVRYDSRSRPSNKLESSDINRKAKYDVSLTTWPDCSYQLTVAPTGKGYVNVDAWEEKKGRHGRKFLLRDYDESAPRDVRQYVEHGTGKIVNEAVLPEKIVQKKFQTEESYKKGSSKYDWTGKRELESVVTKDQLTHKWTKHLPDFLVIETFIRILENQEFTLSSQIESFHSFANHLNASEHFAHYLSEGTFSVPRLPTGTMELPEILCHGHLLSQSSTLGSNVIGY